MWRRPFGSDLCLETPFSCGWCQRCKASIYILCLVKPEVKRHCIFNLTLSVLWLCLGVLCQIDSQPAAPTSTEQGREECVCASHRYNTYNIHTDSPWIHRQPFVNASNIPLQSLPASNDCVKDCVYLSNSCVSYVWALEWLSGKVLSWMFLKSPRSSPRHHPLLTFHLKQKNDLYRGSKHSTHIWVYTITTASSVSNMVVYGHIRFAKTVDAKLSWRHWEWNKFVAFDAK